MQVQFHKQLHSRGLDSGQKTSLHHQRVQKHVEQALERCGQAVDTNAFYSFIAEHGSRYGEAFRQLGAIRWDGHNTAMAKVDMASAKKHYHSVDSPVSPAILDAAMHLVNCYVSRGLTEPIPTLVPQRFDSLWVSAKVWDQDTMSLQLMSELRDPAASNNGVAGAVEKNLYALAENGSPLAVIERLAYMPVSQAQQKQSGDDADADNPLLYGISWKPQLSALSGEQELEQLCNANETSHVPVLEHDETASLHFTAKLEQAMSMAARKALGTINQEHLDRAPVFLRKYTASLQRQFGSPSSGNVLSDNDLEELLRECEAEKPAWRLLPRIARSLGSILRSETDPMELFFAANDTAAGDYYSDLGRQFMQDGRCAYFLELASHETPGLRVLEVGAGTGGMTRHVLAALQGFEAETGQTQFAEYTFTDVSSAFFDAPRQEFSSALVRDRMAFKVLDIGRDPVVQGFEGASYDVIFAASMLHAAADLRRTLTHLHSLLRPNGHLVLLEPVSSESAQINIGFGCFEGWWVGSEPWRQESPLITETHWNELLREAGFSETLLTVRDHKDEAYHFSSMMIARALDISAPYDGRNKVLKGIPPSSHEPTELVVLYDSVSETQDSLAADLAQRHPTITTKMVDMAHFGKDTWESLISDETVVVSLLEIEQAKLASLSEPDFLLLKDLIQKAPQILWITSAPCTAGEDLRAEPSPFYSVATGLLRVIRSEYPDKHVVTLSIEQESVSELANRGKFVDRALQSCFLDQPASAETEFVAQNGHLEIPRALRRIHLDEDRVSRRRPRLRNEPWQPGPAVALEVGTPGLLDTLQFKEDDTSQREAELQGDEVEIRAEAWPISFRDLFIALGRLGAREKMGFEVAGTVTRVGPDCLSVQPGNRVVMGTFSSIRSHPRAGANAILKIPEGLSLHKAMAGINPGITAYHALMNVARLQRGEKILIHSAAGAIGQFAIGVAKMLGAEVLVTIGYNDKKQLLMDRYSIPENHIFYSRNTSFAQGVKRVTNNYSVDIILNSLSGDNLRASWECIAPYSRFIEIRKVDIGANSLLPMNHFAKNATFTAVDMVHIQESNKQLGYQLMHKVLQLAASADFIGIPWPLHLYPVSDVEKAFRYMQSGKHSGRILLTAQDGDVVPKFMTHRSTWQFDENVSYVIAGGLGGLGRPILRWMADRGAKYLIVLSRSGAVSQAAIELVSELQAKNVHIAAPRCDISSATDLSAALNMASFPPIKGCINATMVLQDSIFENMTHEQWSRTLRSKIATSWNLHRLLPRDMHFFVLLSSIIGIYGAPGQSNYAAGCTFQDALARHRTVLQYPGASMSLNLGWIRDDGVVRESADLSRRLATTANFNPVATADCLALLEHYCDPALEPLAGDESQILVGASTPAEVRARGGDPYWAARTRLFAGFDVFAATTSSQTMPTPHGRQQQENGSDTAQQLFRQAADAGERVGVVVAALRTKLARAMGVEEEEIDDGGKGLADYGVDSLMAVELRNWMRRDFGASLAVFEIMQGGKTIRDVGRLVEERKGST